MLKKVQDISATTLQIAINAKKIRELLGLGQEKFSELIGMKISVLKKWDSLKYNPKGGYGPKHILKLSEITGIPTYDLENKKYSDSELFELLKLVPIKKKNIEEVLLELNIQQLSINRVVMRGISELLGSQQGKTVTGVSSDLDRAIKEELLLLKQSILDGKDI